MEQWRQNGLIVAIFVLFSAAFIIAAGFLVYSILSENTDRKSEAGEIGQITSEVESDDSTRFIGVGEILDDGRVAPRRLVVEHGK